jgi:hypothetical protein
MDLGNFADLTDFLAAIGVIASLVYVGYQIKETRRAVRAATAQARTDLGVQLITSRYTSDIADILVKSLSDPESLTKSERFKLNSFFSAHVRHCQNLFYQQQQGLLDAYFSIGVARVTAYWIRNYPWAAEEWEQAQMNVAPEFSNFINEELKSHPSRYDA